jgi:hypothetical protein
VGLTREAVRASFERAGDDQWRALVAHHEEAYPASRPTPGDVARAEAERLTRLGYGDSDAWELVESRVTRGASTLTIVHRLRSKRDGREVTTEPFTDYA